MNQHAKRRHQAELARGYNLEPAAYEQRELDKQEAKAAKAALGPPVLGANAEGLYSFQLPEDQAPVRLDKILAEHFEAQGEVLSRTRLKTLIQNGHVRLGDNVCEDPAQKCLALMHISVDVPPSEPPEPKGEDIPLKIVFEDEHLLILDKPAGLVVHPAAGHETGTLVNALIAHCGDSLSGIGGVRRPGIVHRLDKDTSGLLVVAKNDRAHQGLSELFADHGRTGSLRREYQAFVWGGMDRPQGMINAPLGRHAHMREKMAVVRHDQGREAITHWQLDEFFGSEDSRLAVASLITCALETGRTHQIRVHMAHIGHPLLGDQTYGQGFKTKATKLTPEAQSALQKLKRQALHAGLLGFEHPVTGEELIFESPLPADLQALKDALAG
eukprot:gene14125-14244_t